MLELDGSYGSGGGQILRTALGLAALTGKACRITKVRVKREKPGLRPQHLNGVLAVGKLCDANIRGASIGSTTVTFEPKRLCTKPLKIDIGTAGSVTLILQALMIPLTATKERLTVTVKGGTDVSHSPPIDYTRYVLLPLLRKLGYDARIEVKRRGFYPKGGGEIALTVKPSKLEKAVSLTERGKIESVNCISLASAYLKKAKVAERQAKAAESALQEYFKLPVKVKSEYAETLSPGSVIVTWLETVNSVLGTDSLGERGKPSEAVGREAAEKLIEEYKAGAVVDSHASDQLIPYLAMTGGRIRTSKLTEHARTNAFVTEHFLPVRFGFKNGMIEARRTR